MSPLASPRVDWRLALALAVALVLLAAAAPRADAGRRGSAAERRAIAGALRVEARRVWPAGRIDVAVYRISTLRGFRSLAAGHYREHATGNTVWATVRRRAGRWTVEHWVGWGDARRTCAFLERYPRRVVRDVALLRHSCS